MQKLIRQKDKITKEGFIEFVEFDRDGRGKKIHMKPQVGFSCIVDRNRISSAWQTSSIIEVISNTEFRTETSHYKIEEL